MKKQMIIDEFNEYYYQDPEKFRYFKIYYNYQIAIDLVFDGAMPEELYNYSKFIRFRNKKYVQLHFHELIKENKILDYMLIMGPSKQRTLSSLISNDCIIVRIKKDNNQETFDWLQSVGFEEVTE